MEAGVKRFVIVPPLAALVLVATSHAQERPSVGRSGVEPDLARAAAGAILRRMTRGEPPSQGVTEDGPRRATPDTSEPVGSGRPPVDEAPPAGQLTSAPVSQQVGAGVQDAGNDLAKAAERKGDGAQPSFDSLNASLAINSAGGLELVVDEPDGPGCWRAPVVFDDPGSALAGKIVAAAGSKTKVDVRRLGRFSSRWPDQPVCFESIGADEASEVVATGEVELHADGAVRFALTGRAGRATIATFPAGSAAADEMTRVMQTKSTGRYSKNWRVTIAETIRGTK